jgi:hypothetical protein
VRRDDVHPDTKQRADRRGKRHGSDDVRRAGLVALRRVGPDDLGRRHELDRSAPVQQRLVLGQPAFVAAQRAGSERCVELVARERQEVDAGAGHVDRTVRSELGSVDEQLCPVSVGELGQLGDRPDLAGDVRGAGDGDEVDSRPS